MRSVPQRILALRSDIAPPVLTDGLRALGHEVESVVAYRTVGVAVDDSIRSDVADGRFRAIFVTSGSVAVQVQQQLGLVPDATLVVCIGPRTAADRAAAGCGWTSSRRSASAAVADRRRCSRWLERERPDEDDAW